MPFQRRTPLQTPWVCWQELTLIDGQPAWSDNHRAASPRLLLPSSQWIECERAGHRFVCDGLSPLWLTPDHSYRMRQPWPGQRAVVLIFEGDPLWLPLQRPLLSLQAQLNLARLAAAIEHQTVEPLQAEEVLAAVLGSMHLSPQPSCTLRAQRAVESARALLAEQPQTQQSLSDIARQVHASPFHLARQFRHVTGLSLHAYRSRLRMALALLRLRQGESDLNTLAADLGYSSHSHFGTACRQLLGASPQQLRTNLIAAKSH